MKKKTKIINIALINWKITWHPILNIIYNIICPIGIYPKTLDINLISIALWIFSISRVVL